VYIIVISKSPSVDPSLSQSSSVSPHFRTLFLKDPVFPSASKSLAQTVLVGPGITYTHISEYTGVLISQVDELIDYYLWGYLKEVAGLVPMPAMARRLFLSQNVVKKEIQVILNYCRGFHGP
jgi:hypothetical protein